MKRFAKFLSLLCAITICAVLYVYQQTEILRLAYVEQKKRALYDVLQNKNTILHYTVERRASLVCLGNRLAQSPDFQMPDSYRLIKLVSAEERFIRPAEQRTSRESLLSRFFGVKREAQAKTISSPSRHAYRDSFDER